MNETEQRNERLRTENERLRAENDRLRKELDFFLDRERTSGHDKNRAAERRLTSEALSRLKCQACGHSMGEHGPRGCEAIVSAALTNEQSVCHCAVPG